MHHKFSCSVAIYLFIGKFLFLFVFVLIFTIYNQNCDKKKFRFGNEFRFKYFLGLCSAHVLKKAKLVSVSEDSISTVHSFSLPVPEMKE